MKKRLLAGAALTMLMSVSMMAGATYALFTSESQTDVTVSAGKVSVISTIDEATLKLHSRGVAMPGKTFANGGTATLEGNELTLNNVTPGDKVSFDVTIKNFSTVNVKYRCAVNCIDGYKLYSGLEVDFAAQTSWTDLLPEADPENPQGVTTTATITMPEDLDNDYQGLATKLAILVEAVQGNADVSESITDNVVKNESVSKSLPKVNRSNYISTPTESVTVRVPSSRVDTAKNQLDLSIKQVKQPANFIVPAGKSAIFYDIDLQGITADGYSMDVTLFVGKGLTGWTTGVTTQRYLTVLHEEDGVVDEIVASYYPETGYIKFRTGSFSVFGICADKHLIFNDKNNPELTTMALQKAVEENAKITLNSDVVLTTKDTGEKHINPIIDIVHDLEFDLNGHSIKLDKAPATEFVSTPAILNIDSASKVIIEGNGIIDGEYGPNGVYAININNVDADLYVENGEFYGGPTAIQVQAGSLTINDGTFGMSKTCAESAPGLSKFTINCLDENFENGTANVRIFGGNYINFNPARPNNEKIKSVYAKSNTVTTSTIIDEKTTIYHTVRASEFEDVLETSGTYKLEGDIFLVPSEGSPSRYQKTILTINKPVIIDLNNHNILMDAQDPTRVSGVPVMFEVNSELTIKGNGLIDTNIEGNDNSAYNMILDNETAVVNIEGGDFRAHTTSIQVSKGTLNIKGGTFGMNAEAIKSNVDTKYLINCLDKGFNDGTAKINISGGKFINFNPADVKGEPVNPTSYLVEGYEVQEANGEFTVIKTPEVKPVQ